MKSRSIVGWALPATMTDRYLKEPRRSNLVDFTRVARASRPCGTGKMPVPPSECGTGKMPVPPSEHCSTYFGAAAKRVCDKYANPSRDRKGAGVRAAHPTPLRSRLGFTLTAHTRSKKRLGEAAARAALAGGEA